MRRGLTTGELQILDFVFSDTIDFERHEITTNDANVGGADNSVTYSDTPHYSHQIWCADFSGVCSRIRTRLAVLLWRETNQWLDLRCNQVRSRLRR